MEDDRKERERSFHNRLRGGGTDDNERRRLESNKKFYSVARRNREYVGNRVMGHGGKVLDFCCGNGGYVVSLASKGVDATGIDISDVSIENARRLAEEDGVSGQASFAVMDAEHTEFPDDSFDVVTCRGVLRHLESARAFKELARIVKPNGIVVCNEPLIYNPIFQLYRKRTPELRTKWETEHIISKRDISLASQHFKLMDMRFFHLATLAAVPIRGTPLFGRTLQLLEMVDNAILRLPGVRWLAWQIVFVLSMPLKERGEG